MQNSFNLLDQLFIVAPCPKCSHQSRVPFYFALGDGQQIDCPSCNHPYGVLLGGGMAEALERGFQKIQAQLGQKGCWVEVRPYPE